MFEVFKLNYFINFIWSNIHTKVALQIISIFIWFLYDLNSTTEE